MSSLNNSSPACKIEGCECYKQEIPLHLLYWLSHQGIDLKPLFQKPYIHRKKQYKSISEAVHPTVQITASEQSLVTPTKEVKNSQNTLQSATQDLNSNVNVMDEFLSWNVVPNVETINNNYCGIRRNMPYKIPSTRKNV